MNKKFLILTADTGFGHRAASNALSAAMQILYGDECTLKIVNPALEPTTPYFFRKPQADYDKNLKNIPDIYNFSYQISNSAPTSVIVDNTIAIFLYRTAFKLIQEFQPDVILSTFNFYQTPIHTILNTLRVPIPCFTIVTDLLDVHRLWFQQKKARYFVPSKDVARQARMCGIPEDHIILSGVPVNPLIALNKRGKQQLRDDLGWQADLPTLLAVGSRRVYHLAEKLAALDQLDAHLQLIMVAGGDEQTYAHLKSIPWRHPAYIYNYVENMAEFMLASDMLATKAGGLVISEGLACGLPLLLLDALPGQEAGNVTYVCQNNAGVYVPSAQELFDTVSAWLGDGTSLSFYSKNARKMGHPDASMQIAHTIWQAAQDNPGYHLQKLPQNPFSRQQSQL